jgi:hypothetical protein
VDDRRRRCARVNLAVERHDEPDARERLAEPLYFIRRVDKQNGGPGMREYISGLRGGAGRVDRDRQRAETDVRPIHETPLDAIREKERDTIPFADAARREAERERPHARARLAPAHRSPLSPRMKAVQRPIAVALGLGEEHFGEAFVLHGNKLTQPSRGSQHLSCKRVVFLPLLKS